MHSVKFGLFLTSEDIESAQQSAIYAEGNGFYSVSFSDHLYSPIGELQSPQFECFTALSVLASITKNIKLVPTVAAASFRTPALLAKISSTLDLASNGRFICGLGAGWFSAEYKNHGYSFPSLSDRLEQLEECVQVLKAMWMQEEPSFQGKHFSIQQAYNYPRPVQKPHPPLWIAAVTPTAIYHSVLKGYHVMTTPLRESLDAAMGQIDAFHEGVGDGGETAKDRKFSMLRMLYVAKDKADAREKLEIANANDQRFHNVYTTPGTVKNGAITPIETNRTLEEVNGNLIIGSADECIEKLMPYAERGLLDFLANMSFGAPSRDVMGSMERFARDVMPHFALVSREL